MKKLLSLVLAIIMMLTLTFSTTAAQFVESVTNKGAPPLIIVDRVDGKEVVGFVTGPNGEIISTELLEDFLIVSIADAKTNTKLSDEAKNELQGVYEDLSKSDTHLSDVCPELNKIVKDKWDANKDANDLVVKDLFYVEDLRGADGFVPGNGNILELTFNVGIAGNTFVTAMVFVDGKWKPVVDCVNNGDGTVTVKFDQIGTVAFLVPGSGANTSVVSPTTSDASGIVFYGAVMLVSMVAIVALVVYRRRVNG